MSILVRTWLGFAALGAGLVHLAVAAGAPPVLLATFAALGAAEVVWGVAALARTAPPLPRTTVAAAVLPTVVWVGLLFAGAGAGMRSHSSGTMHATTASTLAGELPVGPMLAASLLDLIVAAVLAVRLRRAAPPADSREPGVWTYLGGVFAGAGVIFAVTSAALGGTVVGQSAMQSMGGH